jgi:molybdopterin-guanine dinucleotide biosynthesis protein B
MIVREMTVGLEDLAPRFADCHLILLEGGKNSPYPKIELLRQGVSEGLVGRPPHLAYCVSGQFELTGAPRLEMDDYEGLADLLESYLRR